VVGGRLPKKNNSGPNVIRANPATQRAAAGNVFARLISTAQTVVRTSRLNSEN
jgi:hypothetical protein